MMATVAERRRRRHPPADDDLHHMTPPVPGLAAGNGEMRTLRGIVRRADARASERLAALRRATDPHPPVRGIRAGAGRARTLGGERDFRALLELVASGTRARDLSRVMRIGATLQRDPVRTRGAPCAPVLPCPGRQLSIADASVWIGVTSAAADPAHAAGLAAHLCDCAVRSPGSEPIGARVAVRRPARHTAPRAPSTADKIDTVAQLAEGLLQLGELGARAARGVAGIIEQQSKDGGRIQRAARRVREVLGGAEDVAAATRSAAGVVRRERGALAGGIDRAARAVRSRRASGSAIGARCADDSSSHSDSSGGGGGDEEDAAPGAADDRQAAYADYADWADIAGAVVAERLYDELWPEAE